MAIPLRSSITQSIPQQQSTLQMSIEIRVAVRRPGVPINMTMTRTMLHHEIADLATFFALTAGFEGYASHTIVDGQLSLPNGSLVRVRTIWIVESPDDPPRFVTAYPG